MTDNKIIWIQHKYTKITVSLVSPDTLLDDRSGIIHTMLMRIKTYEQEPVFRDILQKAFNEWVSQGYRLRLFRDIASYRLFANLVGDTDKRSATLTAIDNRIEEVEFHDNEQKVLILSPSSSTVNDLYQYLNSCIDKKII